MRKKDEILNYFRHLESGELNKAATNLLADLDLYMEILPNMRKEISDDAAKLKRICNSINDKKLNLNQHKVSTIRDSLFDLATRQLEYHRLSGKIRHRGLAVETLTTANSKNKHTETPPLIKEKRKSTEVVQETPPVFEKKLPEMESQNYTSTKEKKNKRKTENTGVTIDDFHESDNNEPPIFQEDKANQTIDLPPILEPIEVLPPIVESDATKHQKTIKKPRKNTNLVRWEKATEVWENKLQEQKLIKNEPTVETPPVFKIYKKQNYNQRNKINLMLVAILVFGLFVGVWIFLVVNKAPKLPEPLTAMRSVMQEAQIATCKLMKLPVSLRIAIAPSSPASEPEDNFNFELDAPDENIAYSLVMRKKSTSKKAQTIGQFDQILTNEPDNTSALIDRGMLLRSKGNHTEAINDFNKILEKDPENFNAYLQRALTHHIAGNFEKALIDYNKAINISPEDPFAFNNRGYLYMDMGKLKEAQIDFNHALWLKEDFTLSYVNRGILFQKAGDLEYAIENFDYALNLNPNDIYVLMLKAYTCEKAQKYDEAKKTYLLVVNKQKQEVSKSDLYYARERLHILTGAYPN